MKTKMYKWIKYFVIPCILLFIWLVTSLFYNSYSGFFTLTHDYPNSNIVTSAQNKLLKGESITGEFIATENNLGTIWLRFTNHDQIAFKDEDAVVFQIKEKNAKSWLYKTTTLSGGIYDKPFYPFGFPKISDSKNKTYVFSLTSQKGNNYNALQLSQGYPAFVSKYVFSKSEIAVNKSSLINFLHKKIISSLTDVEFLIASFIFSLPLLFYLFWIGLMELTEKLRINKSPFFFVLLLLILFMIYINFDLLIGVFLGLMGLWIFAVLDCGIESSVSFLFAFVFFILTFGSVLIGNQDVAGRLSNWVYVFLLIGALQVPWELKNTSDKRINYKELFRKVNLVVTRKKK